MDLTCTAGITKIAIKATETDGIVERTVRMTLAREFDGIIAAAIGSDASTLLGALKDHSCSKVEIPIDLLKGECKLVGERGEEVLVKMVEGVKAVGKAAGAEDDGPSVELIFDFPFQLTAWDFFGKNVGGRAEVTFTKSQLDLPGTDKPAQTTVKKAAEKLISIAEEMTADGGTLSIITDGKRTVLARDGQASAAKHVETEEQSAPTPEEAEALREARLEQERDASRLVSGGGLKNGGLKVPKGKATRVEEPAPEPETTDDDDLAF